MDLETIKIVIEMGGHVNYCGVCQKFMGLKYKATVDHFDSSFYHFRRVYCSNACKQRAYRDRLKQGKNHRRTFIPDRVIQCPGCGQLVVVSKRQRYCSNACKQRAYRVRHGQRRRSPGPAGLNAALC